MVLVIIIPFYFFTYFFILNLFGKLSYFVFFFSQFWYVDCLNGISLSKNIKIKTNWVLIAIQDGIGYLGLTFDYLAR